MVSKVFLAEVNYYDTTTTTEKTLYFSSVAIPPFGASDADRPNQHYDARLTQAGSFARSISIQMDGIASTISIGEVEFSNNDGAYDYLRDHALDGRSITLLYGTAGDAWADYTPFLKGTIEEAHFGFNSSSPSRITLRIRDRSIELQDPIQTTLFAGTNSGSTGIEGLPTDIQGQPKPLCYGEVLRAAPVPVNTAALIYQVHNGAIQAIDAVHDKGVALTFGADRANLAALQAATIASGYYDTCLAAGLIRLGASPTGTVTCNVKGDKTGGIYRNKVADIVGLLAINKGLSLNSASFTALNTANSAVVGIYIPQQTTVSEVVAQLLQSVGGYHIFNALGELEVGRIEAPGTAEATIDENDIISATADNSVIPCWQVALGYGRNFTPQSTTEFAGGVSQADTAQWSLEYRTKAATDAAVKIAHLLSKPLEKKSLLVSGSAADTEAVRLLALHGVRRDLLQIVVPLDGDTVGLGINSTVEVKLKRFGYDSGRLFRVVGMNTHIPAEGQITLDLWG